MLQSQHGKLDACTSTSASYWRLRVTQCFCLRVLSPSLDNVTAAYDVCVLGREPIILMRPQLFDEGIDEFEGGMIPGR